MTLANMISQKTVLIFTHWVLPVGSVAENLNIMLFMHVHMVSSI